MALNEAQWKELLEKLMAGTRVGKFKWSQVGDSDEFMLQREPVAYYVSTRDGDQAAPYVFEIWRERTDRPGEFAMADETMTEPAGILNEPLRDLYAAVRKGTLNLEHLWDDILKTLDD